MGFLGAFLHDSCSFANDGAQDSNKHRISINTLPHAHFHATIRQWIRYGKTIILAFLLNVVRHCDYSNMCNRFLSKISMYFQGSQSDVSSCDEIPMEMDLTAAGPPISDDETELEPREKKLIKVAVFQLRKLDSIGLHKIVLDAFKYPNFYR